MGGGLASLGGGSLVIPMLMGWAGLSPLEARGTALAVSLFTASIATLVYSSHGMLDLKVVLWVGIPALVVTPLAAARSEHWPAARLKAGFGLVVITGGLLVILRDLFTTGALIPVDAQPLYLIIIGVIEGLVAGVIGISGGPVLAPMFVLGLGMPQQLAQGCSLLSRLPAVISGVWENWRLGNVHTGWIPSLALGAIVGAFLGSKMALALPEQGLRIAFGILLIALGLHYLHGSRHPHKPLPMSEWKP